MMQLKQLLLVVTTSAMRRTNPTPSCVSAEVTVNQIERDRKLCAQFRESDPSKLFFSFKPLLQHYTSLYHMVVWLARLLLLLLV